jgi:chromosomal replication initiation ATPase DnaA|tara:strand:- start:397 stop:801 length:405 start_codon:yes stop_codon:yes gene_type:complete
MNKITLQGIKGMVSRKLQIGIGSPIRQRNYVYGRAIYYKLAKEFTHHTFKDIGQVVKKDHASVIHGMKVFEVIEMYSDNMMNVYYECKKHLDNIKNNDEFPDEADFWRDKYENIKELYLITKDKLAEYEKEKVS